jgi:hypothetical protein
VQWTLFKWGVAAVLIGAAGVYAYETGRRLASAEITRLEDKVDTLGRQLAASEALNERERAAAAAAEASARDWQARYERDVARGPSRDLFALIQEKLAAGVEAERLQAVITATQNRRECRREAERRLFPVPVRMQAATRASLNFGKGLLTMVIAGQPARDSAGNAESWFDAGQPVTVRISRGPVVVSEVTGVLPLSPSVIVGEREFSFRIVAARARGHVDVFGESCRFP